MNIIKLKIGVSGIVTTGESDLSNYYTKLEIDNKNFLTEHQDISNKLDKVEAANTYLPKGNYLTEHQSLEQYAKKSEIPTSTNQLTNDSNFLTLHLDISNLATKTELASKADKEHTHNQYLTQHQSLKGYAKSSEIPSKVSQLVNDKNYLTQHQSLVGYAKESWVKNEIANASLQGGDVNLSGLATKEELALKLDTSVYNQDKLNFATKDEIPSLDGYLKEVPAEYVTDTELNQKGYLTEHQDISNKADKFILENGGNGVVTKTINPNTFYKFGVCNSLNLTLSPEISGIYNSYSFEFKSGGSATTLALPDSIKWNNLIKINPNKTYQVSIVNNLAVWGEF